MNLTEAVLTDDMPHPDREAVRDWLASPIRPAAVVPDAAPEEEALLDPDVPPPWWEPDDVVAGWQQARVGSLR